MANNNYPISNNHTFELGPSLQEQVGEAGLAEGWDSIHFPKSQLGAVQPLSLSDTGHGCHPEKYEARVLISCTHICMHAHTLEGTLMWTQVVHVHTLHV